MLPTITVEGNLTRDPELRFTPSGAAVCNFTVVANDRVKQADGSWADGNPTFFNVSVWRRLAENVANSVKKGDQVVVVGKIKQRSYQNSEGENRTVWEVDGVNVGVGLMFAEAESKRMRREQPAQPAQADPWAAGPAASPEKAQAALDPWSATTPAQADTPPF